MGLTTTSFSYSSSNVRPFYTRTKPTNIGNVSWSQVTDNMKNNTEYAKWGWHMLQVTDLGANWWQNLCRVTITTNGLGCTSLGVSCKYRSNSSNINNAGRFYWKVNSTSSVATNTASGGTELTRGSLSFISNTEYYEGSLSGTLSVNLAPNTTYYVWFYTPITVEKKGIMIGTITFTASGTTVSAGNITANNANLGSAVSMSYGATNGGSATYTVTTTVGSVTTTLQTKASTSSRSWTPAVATYAPLNTTGTTLSCTITVTTYVGNTTIGTKTKTITLTITSAQAGPAVGTAFSISPVNSGVVSGLTGYIQGYSKIRANFNSSGVTLQYGATVSSWSVKFGSASAISVNKSTSYYDSSSVISADTSVVLTVTDSRGFTASTTLTATMTPYANPTLTASAYSSESNGTADANGEYLGVNFSTTYASISNQNTISVVAKVTAAGTTTPIIYNSGNISGGTTTTSGTNKTYALSNSALSTLANGTYTITFTATDYLGNTATVTVNSLVIDGVSAGNITANNANFDSPVNMSYAANNTTSAIYTVTVQVGTSTAVTLQTQNATSSRSWTPALATYAGSYPNQNIVPCTITVITYLNGETLGTKTKTISLTMTEAQVGPTLGNAFSIASINTGVVNGLSGYIQGYSKIRATFNPSGITCKYNATVSNWSVKFGSESTITNISPSTTTQDSFENVSTNSSVILTATDSRGYSVSTTLNIDIIPYQVPSITATAYVGYQNGQEHALGKFIITTFSTTYASINGQNTISVVIRAVETETTTPDIYNSGSISGGTTSISMSNKIYSFNKYITSQLPINTYDIIVQATDLLGNTTYETISALTIEAQDPPPFIKSIPIVGIYNTISDKYEKYWVKVYNSNTNSWDIGYPYIYNNNIEDWQTIGGAGVFYLPFITSDGKYFYTSNGKLFQVKGH